MRDARSIERFISASIERKKIEVPVCLFRSLRREADRGGRASHEQSPAPGHEAVGPRRGSAQSDPWTNR